MKICQSLLSAVALFGAAQAAYETEESVLVLGDDTLDTAVEEYAFLLVEFYAPWCGHCKQLAPEYAKAAGMIEDREDTFLAKVDATEHTKAASKYDVSGYPTIIFFKNGANMEYNGGRTASDIVAWIDKKTGPSVLEVSDVAALDALKENNQLVLVIFSSDSSEENKALSAFKKLADGTDDVKFVRISDAAVAKELKLEAENSIVLFKAYDEGRVNFEEDKVTKTKLEKFMAQHMLPYVVEFSDEIVGRLFGGDVKDHMLYFRENADTEDDKKIVDGYRAVAKKNQGSLIFVTVDMKEESNQRLADFFGISSGDYPTVRVINLSGSPIKFKAPAGFELNEAGFELFATKYLAGDIKQSLNSEDTPEDWDTEAVKVVVGDNFKKVCLDEKKNVLLMAHAPWCGHCKALVPIFDKLAKHFQNDEGVLVAKMDSTKNEVEEFGVESFPTLKFFPSNGGKMVDFDGGRTLKDLITYINTNRADGVKGAEPTEDDTAEEDDEDHDEL